MLIDVGLQFVRTQDTFGHEGGVIPKVAGEQGVERLYAIAPLETKRAEIAAGALCETPMGALREVVACLLIRRPGPTGVGRRVTNDLPRRRHALGRVGQFAGTPLQFRA